MNTSSPNGPEFRPAAGGFGQQPTSRPGGYAPSHQQPYPSTPRELGHPAPQPTGRPAPYGTAQAFTSQPRRRKTLAGIVALGVMAVAGGGVVGAATTATMLGDGAPTSSGAGITRVVQADPSNPDWSATAAAVAEAVVAIQVSGVGGNGQGSGVILDAEGNIVTNNHVVASAAQGGSITVVIGSRAHEAEIVGLDPSTDLAVIRLLDPPEDLTTIEFADLVDLEVGDPVMAVGNPLGLSDTVTTGIVSALDRPVATRAVSGNVGDFGNGMVVTAAIQTNAAINPGNSGGALVDASGRLVGITSSIATLTSGGSGQSGNIGIGFAIPANQVRYVVDQLIEKGVAEHAQLGVSASDVTGSSQLGAEVAEVVPGSAADRAGMRPGDLITALDGRPITSSEALVALIRDSEVGQEVELSVLRDGTTQTLTAKLTAAAQ